MHDTKQVITLLFWLKALIALGLSLPRNGDPEDYNKGMSAKLCECELCSQVGSSDYSTKLTNSKGQSSLYERPRAEVARGASPGVA